MNRRPHMIPFEGWIPNLTTGLTEPFVSCDIVQDGFRLQDQSYHLFALIGEREQYGVPAACRRDFKEPHVSQKQDLFFRVSVAGNLAVDVGHPASWVLMDMNQNLNGVR